MVGGQVERPFLSEREIYAIYSNSCSRTPDVRLDHFFKDLMRIKKGNSLRVVVQGEEWHDFDEAYLVGVKENPDLAADAGHSFFHFLPRLGYG